MFHKLFYSIFFAILFFAILLLGYSNNNISIIALILYSILYIPIIFSILWLGNIAIIPFILLTAILFFFNSSIILIIILTFIIPSILVSSFFKKAKNIGLIISFISIYFATITCGFILFFAYEAGIDSIYLKIQETISFLIISINDNYSSTLDHIPNLELKVEIISFIFPSLVAIFFIFWFIFNYKISLFLLKKTDVVININPNTSLPIFHTLILILIAIISVILHKILDKDVNMYYIFYNILFILWFAYCYSGFSVVFNYINKQKSFLFLISFIIMFVILFIQTLIVVGFIGFFNEVKKIQYKVVKR